MYDALVMKARQIVLDNHTLETLHAKMPTLLTNSYTFF